MIIKRSGVPNDFVAKSFDIDYLVARIEKPLAALLIIYDYCLSAKQIRYNPINIFIEHTIPFSPVEQPKARSRVNSQGRATAKKQNKMARSAWPLLFTRRWLSSLYW
ncbi:hypothetical protein [Mucilaginibacter sp.]|uniref:hypothetical protein n=1 Tax=Mucilaginibacter sp. TaxID=1882438 RepID=UPI002CC51F16|nr:hypothetical protein [Mucilaginibacter sp.]HTI61043.1 hypothetical protein [Mucilaginibacter sp.]